MNNGVNNPEVVAAKQALWSTHPEVIVRHVSKVTHRKAEIERRIQQGAWNEVYVVGAEGKRYVLRISREANLIAKEKSARDLAKAAGVSVPSTLDISPVSVDGKELTFELTEFIDGPALHEVTDPAVRKDILVHAGLLLSRLHTIGCLAYGPFPSVETGPKILSLFRKGQISFVNSSLTQISEIINISPSDIEDVAKLAEDLNEKYDEEHPVLVHMDFLPRHLICSVEKKQVIGVLDFGNCRSASPFDDLANWIDGEFALSGLLSGYSNRDLVNSPDFAMKMVLARLQGNIMQFPFALKHDLKDKIPLIWGRVMEQVGILKLSNEP